MVGWETYYEVSDLGRVRSCSRTFRTTNRWGGVSTRPLRGRILKQFKGSNNEYLQVQFSVDGTVLKTLVHRVVAAAFIGDPTGLEVNHKDFNPKNNALSNLELVDRSGNCKYTAKHKRIKGFYGDQKLAEEDLPEIMHRLIKAGFKTVCGDMGIARTTLERYLKNARIL